MLERPEALVLAKQFNEVLKGSHITDVEVGAYPHKMAWLNENRQDYQAILTDSFSGAKAYGGQVEVSFGKGRLLVADGVNVRLWGSVEEITKAKVKHQLRVALTWDEAQNTLRQQVLTFTIQMYGGIWCYLEGDNANPYYLAAISKPAIESAAFDYPYFRGLGEGASQKLSAKAFLATEQRIPGIGNGVLQDILLEARVHPKRKLSTFSEAVWTTLFEATKNVLAEMEELGGRDTETDLFGKPGGYQTKMSKANLSKRCPHCHEMVVKEAYMGGSIYFCPRCQPLT